MLALKPSHRPPGRCHMRGTCGKKNLFSPDLPCPVPDVQAQPPESDLVRSALVSACGPDFAQGPVCCTADQVDSLAANLQQAEALISSCPACRNNFRKLFCAFTCSPNQSQFLDVSATQHVTRSDGKPSTAVKSVEYYIDDRWKTAFFDSCKDVKFGASNGFAMDLIGGGAKDAHAFLKFLGDEKPLVGSPFQINFPRTQPEAAQLLPLRNSRNSTLPPLPFNEPVRHCDDADLLSRCACVDCPSTCAALPVVPPPTSGRSTCHIAGMSCYAFGVTLAYLLLVATFFAGYSIVARTRRGKRRVLSRARQQRSSGFSVFSDGSDYERVRLTSEDDTEARPDDVRLSGNGSAASNGSSTRGNELIGARGLGHFGEQGSSSSSAPDALGRGLGTGVGLGTSDALSALGVAQPRKYVLNNLLSRWFYGLGLFCAKRPYLTFMIGAAFVGVCNIGWTKFEVETDPVRLWVAPDSNSKLQKEYFDEQFGPFYRPEQVFLMDASAHRDLRRIAGDEAKESIAAHPPALSWKRLQWMSDFEAGVRALRSVPHGYQLDDVCFAPAGRGSPCVVQSLMGFFQDDLDGSGVTADNWATSLDECAASPASCLPAFGQPLKQNIVVGGIPSVVRKARQGPADEVGTIVERPGRASDARAAVITWVLDNSLNRTEVARAEEWERAFLSYLLEVSGAQKVAGGANGTAGEHDLSRRRRELGLDLSFSTGVSLEKEIGSSSNTDVGVVVLSYLLMFFYAALTLGGAEGWSDSGGSRSKVAAGTSARPGPSFLSLSARSLDMASYLRGRRGQGQGAGAPTLFPQRNDDISQRRGLVSTVAAFCTRSKFTLGLFGIAIVLISVTCAVGIFSAFNVKVTLIIAEVIPFMLLAVGVDNIFLLCNEMDKQDRIVARDGPYGSGSLPRSLADPLSRQQSHGFSDDADDYEGLDESNAEGQTVYGNLASANAADEDAVQVPSYERAARALSRMGPSILLSATTQIVAFLLGAMVPMPAVRNFALYAAGSMFIVAAMHCTVFIAAMALDADRTESGRLDCLPCITVQRTGDIRLDGRNGEASTPSTASADSGALASFIKFSYAPTLLQPMVKKMVVATFVGIMVLSSIGVRRIEMGLDQRLALPSRSYLRSYFDAVDGLLDVGPPVYFVASSVDPTHRSGQQALCGRFTTCDDLSLANTLEGERRRPDVSFLAEPSSSWIDDFLQWLNPVLETCCRVRKRDPSTFCGPHDSERLCQPCFQDRVPPWNITMDGLPEDGEFLRYLQQWLHSPTDENCPLGGQAAYSSALSLRWNVDGKVSGVDASHFRTSFTPLRSQADFINALEAAERISEDISARTGARVFAYSLFFVFFEQYTYLRSMATQILGAAAIAIFAITTLLLGSWRTGLIVTVCISNAVFGVAGMMGYWGIQLNALTLVNLSVCSAIGVEFCAHIARAFMRAPGSLPRSHPMSQKERDERAWAALSDVGDSVLSGIFTTKLLGVGVLIFTKSDLLKLYYARTWLSLILLGFLHGLVLLPVLLSLLGGRGWSNGEDENDVKRRLQRAGAEYRPLLTNDEEDSEGSEGLDDDGNVARSGDGLR
ncbi:niemann-Pick type C-related protein 1 [Thecaphora frezii]